MRGKLVIEGSRFNTQTELALYKKEQKKKGMFRFPKPLLVAVTEDAAVIPLLEAIATVELKGTMCTAYKEDDNGNLAFAGEMEGEAKGDWGGGQTSEAAAAGAQADSEPSSKDRKEAKS